MIKSQNLTYNSIACYSYAWDAEKGERALIEHIETEDINNFNCTLSYSAPSNHIDISFTPKTTLSYWEARVTSAADTNYGIGIGVRAAYIRENIIQGNIQTVSIPVNSTTFPKENLSLSKTFRVSLYSKRDSDGIWDATYLLIDTDGKVVVPTDANGVEVLLDLPIPEN